MNLEFIKTIFIERIKRGDDLCDTLVDECFEITRRFIDKGIENGYIVPEKCKKCGGDYTVINTAGEYRVQCNNCNLKATGSTKVEAINKLWAK